MPTKHTHDVSDLTDLIFNPTLDAGIELHNRVELIISQRDRLLRALKSCYELGIDKTLVPLVQEAIAKATGEER